MQRAVDGLSPHSRDRCENFALLYQSNSALQSILAVAVAKSLRPRRGRQRAAMFCIAVAPPTANLPLSVCLPPTADPTRRAPRLGLGTDFHSLPRSISRTRLRVNRFGGTPLALLQPITVASVPLAFHIARFFVTHMSFSYRDHGSATQLFAMHPNRDSSCHPCELVSFIRRQFHCTKGPSSNIGDSLISEARNSCTAAYRFPSFVSNALPDPRPSCLLVYYPCR